MTTTDSDYAGKLDRLTRGRLQPSEFAHADHIGVAFEALSRWDFFEAASRVADGIRSLAEAAGAPEKFHATITFAYLSLIAERKARMPELTAAAFIEANPELGQAALLKRYFSDRRLTSPLAREIVLMPDRLRSEDPTAPAAVSKETC